jgi:hypothetical protein
MLRIFSAPTLSGVLGLGGLALAQDGLIVDPWTREVSRDTAAATAPVGADRTRQARSGSPVDSQPEVANAGPSVEPLGPPLVLTLDPWAVVPVAPVLTDKIVDPWTGSRLATRATRGPLTTRRGHTDWARAIDEIIDPWAKGPLAVVTDPLIVDPWAR